MADTKGWKLRVRNGDADKEIAFAFTRASFPGTEHIETVDDLDVPELCNPDQNVVARGEEEIKSFIHLLHEFDRC